MVDRRKRHNSAGLVIVITSLILFALAGIIFWAAQDKSGDTGQTANTKQPKKNDAPTSAQPANPPVPDAPMAKLTPEQRAAWERARAKWDKQSHYVYALRGVQKPEWKSVDGKAPFVQGEFRPQVRCTSSPVGDAFPIDGEGVFLEGRNISRVLSPELASQSVATEPETQIAVVVDLFSNRDPVVRAWFQFQGNAVKELKNAPSVAIADSFAKHMRYVQQRIGN